MGLHGRAYSISARLQRVQTRPTVRCWQVTTHELNVSRITKFGQSVIFKLKSRQILGLAIHFRLWLSRSANPFSFEKIQTMSKHNFGSTVPRYPDWKSGLSDNQIHTSKNQPNPGQIILVCNLHPHQKLTQSDNQICGRVQLDSLKSWFVRLSRLCIPLDHIFANANVTDTNTHQKEWGNSVGFTKN